MNLRIDLTDVAARAILNDRLCGIQRVQIEFSKALRMNRGETSTVFAKTYSFHRSLDHLRAPGKRKLASQVYNDIRQLYRISLPERLPLRARVANALLKLKLSGKDLARRDRARVFRLGSKDTLYVGGVFWAEPYSVEAYEQATRDGCDIVILFHDFIPIDFPHLTDGGARPLFERMLKLPARAIVDSQYSKARLEEARRVLGAPRNLPCPAVAYEFAGARRNQPARHPPTGRTASLAELGTFAVCVGTIEARKNHANLIRLGESLAREFGEGWPRFVGAGRPGWGAPGVVKALRRLDRGRPFISVGAPTDEELAWLYGRSRFTVFPSLAEGWGLPIGESSWFGKPCVASNTTRCRKSEATCAPMPTPTGSTALRAPSSRWLAMRRIMRLRLRRSRRVRCALGRRRPTRSLRSSPALRPESSGFAAKLQ